MKKKIFSLIVILIVAICGGVFVGCGGAGNKDLSISINAGLDVQEEGVLGIGEELFLTDGELQNLKNGKAFNNTVQSGTAVSLVLGSEKYSSREIEVTCSAEKRINSPLASTPDSIAQLSSLDISIIFPLWC